MSLLQPVVLTLLAVLAFLAAAGGKKAIELVLEKEYPTWAGGLARLLMKAAARFCPERMGQWWADLLYVQSVEKESGILRAGSCLVAAAWFALHQAARAGRARQREEPGGAEEAMEVLERSEEAPIEELDLTLRAYNILRKAHITTVGQLMTTTEDELLSLRNCGRRALAEYKEQLVAKGFVQPDDVEDHPLK